ncbi:MAG: transcription elongation factor GreA [Acidimicrobiia bacterium]|nr:transcription elongation factor GreA [Acidimicrobiia bacterium]
MSDLPTPDAPQLSRAAFERLKVELAEMTTHGRVDIARKIEVAREMGDLKENGDYHAAKEEQGKMEGRIQHIEALLAKAEIVEGASGSEVAAGSIVEIRYEGDDSTERYLLGSIEERQELDVISPGSPLGQSLLGSRPGETVEFEAPTGAKLRVEVVAVE